MVRARARAHTTVNSLFLPTKVRLVFFCYYFSTEIAPIFCNIEFEINGVTIKWETEVYTFPDHSGMS